MALRTPTKRNIRELLYVRQDGRCCYCDRRMFRSNATAEQRREQTGLCGKELRQSGLQATIEHLRPKSQGGTDHRDNLALACFRCNTSRGAVSWVEFKSRMSSLMALAPTP